VNQRRYSYLPALAIFLLLTVQLGAQPSQAQQTSRLDAVTVWKIVNTLLFFGLLAYAIWKYGPSFFKARSLAIQKAIEEATGLRIEAEFRYSQIDKKMATLPEEIRKLREEDAEERERDHRAFIEETENAVRHIWHNANAEIDAFRQQGVRQVRQRAAELALQIAEVRIRDRFGAIEPDDLVNDFVRLAAGDQRR
jgi:F-type H+-transporting ATPase subunit b